MEKNRSDVRASKAVRKSTLKSLKAKKRARLRQMKDDFEKAVREVNIKYAEDPERLRAKYAADDYAKNEKAKRRAKRKIENEKKRIERLSKRRIPTLAEEIFSAIVQGVSAAVSIAATAIVVYRAATYSPRVLRSAYVATFATSSSLLIVMYVLSTLRHALVSVTAKEVFARLSYSFVFLIIGSVYTAFSLIVIDGAAGWILFGIVWAFALVGIIVESICGYEAKSPIIVLCLLVGWIGVFFSKRLYERLPILSFSSLIAAGVFYTVSSVFFIFSKVKFLHCIGNIFSLAGTILLLSALYFAVV